MINSNGEKIEAAEKDVASMKKEYSFLLKQAKASGSVSLLATLADKAVKLSGELKKGSADWLAVLEPCAEIVEQPALTSTNQNFVWNTGIILDRLRVAAPEAAEKAAYYLREKKVFFRYYEVTHNEYGLYNYVETVDWCASFRKNNEKECAKIDFPTCEALYREIVDLILKFPGFEKSSRVLYCLHQSMFGIRDVLVKTESLQREALSYLVQGLHYAILYYKHSETKKDTACLKSFCRILDIAIGSSYFIPAKFVDLLEEADAFDEEVSKLIPGVERDAETDRVMDLVRKKIAEAKTNFAYFDPED